MIDTIRNLFSSRKFLLLLVGVIVAIAARAEFQLDSELVLGVLTIFGIAIGGIAYEDGQAKGAGLVFDKNGNASIPDAQSPSLADEARSKAMAARAKAILDDALAQSRPAVGAAP